MQVVEEQTAVFEEMIQNLLNYGFGSVDNLFSALEVVSLREALMKRYEADRFQPAGIGDQFNLTRVSDIRSDQILWLSKESAVLVEQSFFKRLDEFVAYLNRTCFAGIDSYEFHYAVYEPGSFYKRHKDQFTSSDQRKFSLVIYLNDSWNPGDGGELVIYTDSKHCIEPVPGRVVFFSSELEHEVLTSKIQRKSLTGWLKTI
ncbi:MAG: 2OG-Fe(II) oxygenase [Crocinitomicaceae bacterium]|nr:2OG-Fe(II) oxygenase [Crocinitomicaceae bacterium]